MCVHMRHRLVSSGSTLQFVWSSHTVKRGQWSDLAAVTWLSVKPSIIIGSVFCLFPERVWMRWWTRKIHHRITPLLYLTLLHVSAVTTGHNQSLCTSYRICHHQQQLNNPRWALASSVVFRHSSLSLVLLLQFLTLALATSSVYVVQPLESGASDSPVASWLLE